MHVINIWFRIEKRIMFEMEVSRYTFVCMYKKKREKIHFCMRLVRVFQRSSSPRQKSSAFHL